MGSRQARGNGLGGVSGARFIFACCRISVLFGKVAAENAAFLPGTRPVSFNMYTPGTKTLEYLQKDRRLIGRVQHLAELPLVVAGTCGPYIIDAEGRRILDFMSSACTQNLGFDRPDFTHSGAFPFPYACGTTQIDYAELLVAKFPGAGGAGAGAGTPLPGAGGAAGSAGTGVPGTAARNSGGNDGKADIQLTFGVCGSETIDEAIKLARACTGRQRILSFRGDYHGKTYGSASITTMPGAAFEKFGPMLPGCLVTDFCHAGESTAAAEAALARVEAEARQGLAAVVFEAVQGDLGMLPVHPLLLQGIFALASRYGFLTVSDEIQLAFYRTGPFFSVENYPRCVPDIICMGKNLGGGLPLSAVLARREIMDVLDPLDHAFTFAGNSEACGRGLVNFRKIEELHSSGALKRLETQLRRRLDGIQARFPFTSHTGLGLAHGLWIKSPFPQWSAEQACFMVMWRCFEEGLYTQRLDSSFLRLEPQLNLGERLLNEGFDIIEQALADLADGKIGPECLQYMLDN